MKSLAAIVLLEEVGQGKAVGESIFRGKRNCGLSEEVQKQPENVSVFEVHVDEVDLLVAVVAVARLSIPQDSTVKSQPCYAVAGLAYLALNRW